MARRSLPQIGVQVAHDHVRQRVVSILDEQRRRVVGVLAERSARTQAHAARCSQIAISDGCGARLAAAAHSSMCSPNLGETTKNCAAPAAAAACAILSNTCRRDPWAGGRHVAPRRVVIAAWQRHIAVRADSRRGFHWRGDPAVGLL